MNGAKVLTAEGLEFSFQNQNTLFQNLNLEVTKNEIVVLMGSSGSGKSTLLRIFGGLLTQSQGKIQNNSKKSAFVFQEPRLLPWRTCEENILLPIEISKLPPSESLEEILKTLKILEARAKFPSQLSGGMKMRTSIARALVQDPDFIYMDEPFSALDENTREGLQTEIRDLILNNGSKSCLFVTHSIDEAVAVGDRIFYLHQQQLKEFQYKLPKTRPQRLREDPLFFEATRNLRKWIGDLS